MFSQIRFIAKIFGKYFRLLGEQRGFRGFRIVIHLHSEVALFFNGCFIGEEFYSSLCPFFQFNIGNSFYKLFYWLNIIIIYIGVQVHGFYILRSTIFQMSTISYYYYYQSMCVPD